MKQVGHLQMSYILSRHLELLSHYLQSHTPNKELYVCGGKELCH